MKKAWDHSLAFLGNLNPLRSDDPLLGFGRVTERVFEWGGSMYTVSSERIGTGSYGSVYK